MPQHVSLTRADDTGRQYLAIHHRVVNIDNSVRLSRVPFSAEMQRLLAFMNSQGAHLYLAHNPQQGASGHALSKQPASAGGKTDCANTEITHSLFSLCVVLDGYERVLASATAAVP